VPRSRRAAGYERVGVVAETGARGPVLAAAEPRSAPAGTLIHQEFRTRQTLIHQGRIPIARARRTCKTNNSSTTCWSCRRHNQRQPQPPTTRPLLLWRNRGRRRTRGRRRRIVLSGARVPVAGKQRRRRRIGSERGVELARGAVHPAVRRGPQAAAGQLHHQLQPCARRRRSAGA
jgi:hypothetical protein